MTTNFKSIPIIDVGPLVAKWDDLKMGQHAGVGEVVKQLNQACRETGFFYVKGHGIPESLIKEVRDVTHKFFELPYDEKLKIKMTQATGYRGYQKIKENITKGVPDLQEAVDYYREVKRGMYGTLGETLEGCNQWPEDPTNFKASMKEYIRLCTDLSRKIMRGIALALGGSADEFEGERGGDALWVMRLVGYPGISTANGQNNDIGCGIHTDYDIAPLFVKWNDPKLAQDPGVCEVLDEACREAGFFYVKGHGIPETMVKEIRNITHKFFDLPCEEKLTIKMTAATGYRGYQRIGENLTKGVPDMHEAIDCYKELKQGMYGALGKPMEGLNQ